MINNKKGISDVVTTVLIILLVLAAIVIVWSFIRPTLQRGGENIDVSSRCLDLTATVVSCAEQPLLAGERNYDVVVRNDNSVATKLKVVFTNSSTTYTKDSAGEIAAFSTSGTEFSGLIGDANVNTNTVKVMPLVKDASGEYQPCDAQITSAFTCSATA